MAGVEENAGHVEGMRASLLEWYAEAGRSFPWREEEDPYRILILEVMSQQTQLERIADPWRAFVERWPTPTDLATASVGDVIAFWSEHRLGYNRRARYLHGAAQRIVEEWDGEIPPDPDKLEELPGVGPYTASAVAAFAFDAPSAVVDTNVERVLHRAFGVDEGAYEEVAALLVPPDGGRTWNNAIMDLGAVVCTPTPDCEACPWQGTCEAYESGNFEVPTGDTQPAFRGSRRQYRGRIVRALASQGPLPLDELGAHVHEQFGEDPAYDRSWLEGVIEDLAADGLVRYDRNAGRIALPDGADHS